MASQKILRFGAYSGNFLVVISLIAKLRQMESQNFGKKRGRPRREVKVSENSEDTEENQSSSSKRRGRPRNEERIEENSIDNEENQNLSQTRSGVRLREIPESTVESTRSKEKKKQMKWDLPSKPQWKRIVGTLPGYIIPSQRLPTNRVILQRFDILRSSMSTQTSTHTFSALLYDEILPIWRKANIPVVERRLCLYRLEELIKSWTKNNCRKMVEGSEKEKKYTKMLDSLFSMTYTDLEEVKSELRKDRLLQREEKTEEGAIKRWERDFDFLLNQMKNPQVGTIGRSDSTYNQKKLVQDEKEVNRKKFKEVTHEIEEERRRKLTGVEVSNVLGEDEESDESNTQDDSRDPDYIPPRGRKPKKHSTVMLELPTKDLVKEAASICARLKLSNTAITTLYSKIIVSGGGDLKDFVMSKTTTWRHRIAGEKAAEQKLKIRLQGISEKHPYGILHWDGKNVKFQSGKVEEHLVICLQRVSSDEQPHFLGAPQTPNGTGVAQAEAVVRYIDETGVEDQLIAHVWDTTASNTGCNLGAAILLDQALGRANLWLGCRRHAAERHIVHANTAIFGPTKSPEEALFKVFQSNFDSLDKNTVQKYEWSGDESSPVGPFKFQTERALAVKVWAEECCRTGVFPREDYRELLELITHVLGGRIVRKSVVNKEAPPRAVQFKMERPGAFHHARFMSKAIYYIKMFMLAPQLLQKGLITHFETTQIEKMSTFVILMYGQYFLQTAITCAAPRIDLEFWRNANRYV